MPNTGEIFYTPSNTPNSTVGYNKLKGPNLWGIFIMCIPEKIIILGVSILNLLT